MSTVSIDSRPPVYAPPRTTRVRIGVLGGGLFTRNLGVSALTVATVSLIHRLLPRAEIVLIDYGTGPASVAIPTGDHDLHVAHRYLRFSKRLWQPNHILRLLAAARFSARPPSAFSDLDAFVALSGGDSFSDIYGLRRLVYVALPQVLALTLGRPLLQFPQTFGPFRSAPSRWLARAILARSRQVCCRDDASRQLLHQLQLAPPAQTSLCPDVAFALPARQPPGGSSRRIGLRAESASPRPVIGLNVSGLLWRGGYNGRNMFRLATDYRAFVRELVQALLNGCDANLRLISHVLPGLRESESDDTPARALMDELSWRWPGRIARVEPVDDPALTKGAIGECELLIGSRLHACIAALSQGIPAVGLAYSDKFAGVFATAGAENLVIDLRIVSPSQAISLTLAAFHQRALHARRLRERLPAIHDALNRTVTEAFASLVS